MMLRLLFACLLAMAAFPSRADTVLSIVSSAPSEWVGQGKSLTYTNANATFTVTGDRTRVLVRVVGTDGKTWNVRFKPRAGEFLRVHRFWQAEREGFETGHAPGMDFSGDGRSCGDVYGDFGIRQIGFDAAGKVNLLEASVLQRCNTPDAPALAAVLMYRAPKLSFSVDTSPTSAFGGRSARLYNDLATFSFSGTQLFLLRADGGTSYWHLMFQLPYGETEFRKGMYYTYDHQVGTLAGLSLGSDGVGDGGWGKFEVLTVSNYAGLPTQMSARFWVYRDEARTQLVYSGTFNWTK